METERWRGGISKSDGGSGGGNAIETRLEEETAIAAAFSSVIRLVWLHFFSFSQTGASVSKVICNLNRFANRQKRWEMLKASHEARPNECAGVSYQWLCYLTAMCTNSWKWRIDCITSALFDTCGGSCRPIGKALLRSSVVETSHRSFRRAGVPNLGHATQNSPYLLGATTPSEQPWY